jgi:hypothetical protein
VADGEQETLVEEAGGQISMETGRQLTNKMTGTIPSSATMKLKSGERVAVRDYNRGDTIFFVGRAICRRAGALDKPSKNDPEEIVETIREHEFEILRFELVDESTGLQLIWESRHPEPGDDDDAVVTLGGLEAPSSNGHGDADSEEAAVAARAAEIAAQDEVAAKRGRRGSKKSTQAQEAIAKAAAGSAAPPADAGPDTLSADEQAALAAAEVDAGGEFDGALEPGAEPGEEPEEGWSDD